MSGAAAGPASASAGPATGGIEWREREPAETVPAPMRPEDLSLALGVAAPRAGDPVAVLVAADAMAAVFAHGRASRLEQGGILLGRAYRDPAAPPVDGTTRDVVDVARALPAPAARSTETFFRFGPETWAALRARWLETAPGLDLVGWYHTHPDLGVFFSGTDRATQRDFFARPWLLGLVVDPVRGTEAWFAGAESRPVRSVRRYGGPLARQGESLAPASRALATSPVDRPTDPTLSTRTWARIRAVGDGGRLRLADGSWARLADVRLRAGVCRPKPVRRLERAARRRLARALVGRTCELLRLPAGAVHVVLDGRPVAASILRAGLACLVADEAHPFSTALAEAERAARIARAGVWGRRFRLAGVAGVAGP